MDVFGVALPRGNPMAMKSPIGGLLSGYLCNMLTTIPHMAFGDAIRESLVGRGTA
jgi:hypothetical protein